MELPETMASLQLQDSGNKSPPNSDSCVKDTVISAEAIPVTDAAGTSTSVGDQTTSRTLRKRLGTPLQNALNALKKQKLSLKRPENLSTDKEIADYYIKVNKKKNVKQSNLETIFEEPVESKDGQVLMMSGAKHRRSLVFSGRLTKAKKLKRNAKVKKFQLTEGKSIGEKKKKLSIDEVKMRLAESLDSWNELFECSE